MDRKIPPPKTTRWLYNNCTTAQIVQQIVQQTGRKPLVLQRFSHLALPQFRRIRGFWAACHAEGRGFESLQPLLKKPRKSRGFSLVERRGQLVIRPALPPGATKPSILMRSLATGEGQELPDPWWARAVVKSQHLGERSTRPSRCAPAVARPGLWESLHNLTRPFSCSRVSSTPAASSSRPGRNPWPSDA
jgi:hypothetical protein